MNQTGKTFQPVTVNALILALILALVCAPGARAEDLVLPALSANATVSLVTMWPGREIYIAFGHSAFRVRDPSLNIDEVFNYGTFDFEDPLFIPKFIYGELNYYLVHYPYKLYYDFSMRAEKRKWFEQVLDLDRNQMNKVFRFLMVNSLPENKHYKYDFIKDNCATRIRDVLVNALGDEVVFNDGKEKAPGKSYRIMMDEYVADRPLYQFGFYLVLGTASDKPVTASESTFLPHYLMRFMDTVRVKRDGESRNLVRFSRTLFEPVNEPEPGTPLQNPAFFLWPYALLTLVLTGLGIRSSIKTGQGQRYRLSRILDFILFFVMGIVGCLVFYLSVFSEHTATKGNLNMIWMWPTHLVASFFIAKRKTVTIMRWYFLAAAIACIVPLITWPVWPQGMHPTMIPLMLMLAVRSFRSFFVTEKNPEPLVPAEDEIKKP